MINIIGTSHISPESLEKIKRTIKRVKPQCIAIELDQNRLVALQRGEKITIAIARQIGFRNYLIAKFLSMIQRYLGKKTGVLPGTEMLIAIKAAREAKAKIALIDQHIAITLNKLRQMPFREKLGIFLSLFKKKEVIEFDIRDVPSQKVVDAMINYLKETSPTLYRVLIEERDKHMAMALFQLSSRYKKIVAIVGMGHVRGIKEELKELEKGKISYEFTQDLQISI